MRATHLIVKYRTEFSTLLHVQPTVTPYGELFQQHNTWPRRTRVTGSTVRSLNPGKVKRFSLLHERPYRLWGPPSLLFNRYRDCVSSVKRSECEVNFSLPSRGEGKNEWGCISTPPIRLRDVTRMSPHVTFCYVTYVTSCYVMTPNAV
jgi:hypothetical protein